jgi:ATP-binding cassette, subfamily F, member 3
MSLISAHNLGHSYGQRDLFSQLDFRLEAKQRVGLVGPNGSGKTTLLLILAGLLEPTHGRVARQNDLTLGYLRQEAVLAFRGQANSIYEEMLTVFAAVTAIEQNLRELEQKMADGAQDEALLAAYGAAQQAYEAGGGYAYHTEIKRVLLGVGFAETRWGTPLSHLSGGEKTRLLLARLLLEKPDLLILDEPTNHLDTAVLAWLERTLRLWEGTLLIVSHDRYFLDKVVSHIWELHPRQLLSYKGDYSSYLQQRQAHWQRETALFSEEMARLQAELEFIRRNIAGSQTDLAKGKLKRLTRDIILMEQVGVLGREGKNWSEIGSRTRTFTANEAAQRLQSLKPPQDRPPQLNMRLQTAEASEQLVLRTARLTIGYPDAPLFKTDKLRLERGEIAALLGPNGSGKSTFLRTLLGQIRPLRGEIELGENVQIGYFAQAHEQLRLENRVLDELLRHRPTGEQEARTYLAQYLFRGQDVLKKVSDLSGGERGRLALAILAAQGANFLLLDEPTNHLDIPAQEVLQAVLERYDGTILLVSHDRYLVSHLATQIWAIAPNEQEEKGEGLPQLTVFRGDYEAFVGQQEVQAAVQAVLNSPAPVPTLDWVAELAPPTPPATATQGKRKRRGGSALELAIQNAEIWLDKLEQELAIAREMGDGEQEAWLLEEYDTAVAELDELLNSAV